jgi:hypothetical protein
MIFTLITRDEMILHIEKDFTKKVNQILILSRPRQKMNMNFSSSSDAQRA